MSSRPVRDLEYMLTDPVPYRYDVNFRLPEGLPPGRYALQLKIGNRALLPREIEVVAKVAG